ncbi:putative GTPase effector domain, Dynamin superfamily [Helianthus anomalus]
MGSLNVHGVLKDLVHKSINETSELKQYPSMRAEVMNATAELLNKMRDESKRATIQLVDMECNYLTADFFQVKSDRMCCLISTWWLGLYDTLSQSLLCTLKCVWLNVAYLTIFFTELGAKEGKQLAKLLDEDPKIMQRRLNLAKRLELYKSARTEVDAVVWAK